MIRKFIKKIKDWFWLRKYRKYKAKLGSMYGMDNTSMYPYVMKSAIFPLNKDSINAYPDSVRKEIKR